VDAFFYDPGNDGIEQGHVLFFGGLKLRNSTPYLQKGIMDKQIKKL